MGKEWPFFVGRYKGGEGCIMGFLQMAITNFTTWLLFDLLSTLRWDFYVDHAHLLMERPSNIISLKFPFPILSALSLFH